MLPLEQAVRCYDKTAQKIPVHRVMNGVVILAICRSKKSSVEGKLTRPSRRGFHQKLRVLL